MLSKGVYFVMGSGLFYVKDTMPLSEYILIENCKTNKATWIRRSGITVKEVIDNEKLRSYCNEDQRDALANHS